MSIIRRFGQIGAISSMFNVMRVNGSARRDASLVMLLLVEQRTSSRRKFQS
jgi:hypothetical protein